MRYILCFALAGVACFTFHLGMLPDPDDAVPDWLEYAMIVASLFGAWAAVHCARLFGQAEIQAEYEFLQPAERR